MPASYDDLLARLDPFPKLVRRPLSREQIESLEQAVGLPAPRSVRAWLSKLGLFQEAGCANASDFEIYEQPAELIESRKAILNLLGDQGRDLFPFGHDGAGDEIAVRAGQEDDTLIFVDHETRTARPHASFGQWLREVVDEVVEKMESEGGEAELFWCVQFTFETASEKPILDLLKTIAPITAQDTTWEDRPTSATGVREARMGFAFLGQGRILSRSTDPSWSTPHFAFDYEEPASTPPSDSVIRRLDELFRGQPALRYKLVDYGPMEWPPTEEAEVDNEPASKKPWWRFW